AGTLGLGRRSLASLALLGRLRALPGPHGEDVSACAEKCRLRVVGPLLPQVPITLMAHLRLQSVGSPRGHMFANVAAPRGAPPRRSGAPSRAGPPASPAARPTSTRTSRRLYSGDPFRSSIGSAAAAAASLAACTSEGPTPPTSALSASG